VYSQDHPLKSPRKLSIQQQAVLQNAPVEGAMNTVDSEQSMDDDEEAGPEDPNAPVNRYYAYQLAIGGTASCIEPPIEPSTRALGTQRVEDNGQEAYEWLNNPSEELKRKPKPYQVNGTA
jgi:hypothetical protein